MGFKKEMTYLLLTLLIFALAQNNGLAQSVKEDSCVFSKEKWVTDSTGKTGYRYLVLTACECPTCDKLFSSVTDSLSIIESFGKPDAVEKRKNKGITITYYVYEGKHLREQVHFHLNRRNQVEVVLFSKVGG